MLQAIKNFIFIYANCKNIIIPTVIIMFILLVVYVILSFRDTRSLKKINKVLRNESGDEIIRIIEDMKLSKRYAAMWDDYYDAYCHEDTVSLSSYLIKNDLKLSCGVFRYVSRCVAVIGFSAAATAAVMIPYLFDVERNALICMFFILVSIEAFFEIFYKIFSCLREKRLARLLEEFEMLAMRKLPGKAISFSQKHFTEKFSDIDARLEHMHGSINQLNARMDRQYKFIVDQSNKTDIKEEPKE